MPAEQRPDRVVAGCPKRLASRFYQLKTGHCFTWQYLKHGEVWVVLQTREHLFKDCPRWKLQQKPLWAEVRRDTGRGKNRFKTRDSFADERCTRAIPGRRRRDGGWSRTERRMRIQGGKGKGSRKRKGTRLPGRIAASRFFSSLFLFVFISLPSCIGRGRG
jgi:hypothetical protein